MADPYKAFGLSCPQGGTFYICTGNATEFLGCCTTDPCTAAAGGKCPKANLRLASFSADRYDQMPRQDCDDAQSIKIWYTCKFNKPPFMGCCNSNPCANGTCPQADLVPAKLSGDVDFRQPFLVPTATGTAAASATAAPPVAESGGGLSAGAVAGIVVSVSIVLLVAVGAAMYRWGWKARSTRTRDIDDDPYASPRPEGYGMSERGHGNNGRDRYSPGFSPYRDSYQSNHPTLAYGPGSPPLHSKHGGYYEGGAMHSPPLHAVYHHQPHNRNPSRLSEMGAEPMVSELPGHEIVPLPTARSGATTPELAARQAQQQQQQSSHLPNVTPSTATTAASIGSPTLPPAHPSPLNSAHGSPMMPSPGRFEDTARHTGHPLPGTRRPLVGGPPRGYNPVRGISPDPDD